MPNKAFAFLPSDARLIPGHGVAMTREDVRWHIDYLQAVRDDVQKAIDQGLDLELTLKATATAMEKFRGYDLFDWIHSSLNVPKAFEELNVNKGHFGRRTALSGLCSFLHL